MTKQRETQPKKKHHFDLKVETLLPATLIYKRVLAESPEEAIKLIGRLTPNNVQYRLPGKRDRKITIYDAGTLMIKFVKNLLGH